MMSEILPLAKVKQDLSKSKVCKNAQELRSRDLCFTFCETVELLSTVLWRVPWETWALKGSGLGQWADEIGTAMESAKPIPEEERWSELCEKHTESARRIAVLGTGTPTGDPTKDVWARGL